MPGLNRKGPLGESPRTGRNLGKCGRPNAAPMSRPETDGIPDFQPVSNQSIGKGGGRGKGSCLGGGRGGGRGRGRR